MASVFAILAIGCSSSKGNDGARATDFCGVLAFACNVSRQSCDNLLAQDATDHPKCKSERDDFLNCLAGKSLTCDGTSVYAGVSAGSGSRYDLLGYSAYADGDCASSGDQWAACTATGPLTWTVADSFWTPNSEDPKLVHVEVTSYPNACAVQASGGGYGEKANASFLFFTFERNGTGPIPAGKYPIAKDAFAPTSAQVDLLRLNATCGGFDVVGTSGSITLDANLGASGAAVTGRYDIQFEDGKSATGEFDAGECDIAGKPTCIQ